MSKEVNIRPATFSFITLRRNTAPDAASVGAGEAALWFDPTNGSAALKLRGKSLDGTVVNTTLGSGGGGGSPAGPSGAIQFNNSGAFGGFGTWDSVNSLLSLGGSPITPFAGLYVGPNESTLPAIIQGYNTPSGALITNTGLGAALAIEDAGTGFPGIALAIVEYAANNPHGILATAYGVGGAAVTNVYGVYSQVASDEAGTVVGLASSFYAGPSSASELAIITTIAQFYATSLAGAALQGSNAYYSWFDSQGVRRVKEDSTFNSVGQAIEALYNPQFTKYTPGEGGL